MWPYYNRENNVCRLSGYTPDPGHRDYNCLSKDNCTHCGNYEAKMSGRNYQDKW
jgi:ribosomal protein L37E